MPRLTRNNINDILYLTFITSFLLWTIASWFTHIIVCINNKEWLFLIAGAIMAPIAWVHGTGIWFNFW